MSSATLPAAGDVTAILRQARSLVEPALREAVRQLHPDLARVASYHCGWTTAEGQPAEHDGGKRLRAALVFLSALAAGATEQVAVPGAVAVELVHAFSLLHDDVMDGDRLRRGRPTAWTKFGVGAAVLTGDALLTLGVRTIAAAGHPRLAVDFIEVITALCHGQAHDASFEQRGDVSTNDYLAMIGGKTTALVEFACTVGAVLAHAPQPLVDGLGRIGNHLGTAFQVTDDILGIWGDPGVTGKPAGDLARRKKSLPVVAALTSNHPDSDRLRQILLDPDRPMDEDTIATCAQLIEAAGGRARAETEVQWHHTQALRVLDDLQLPKPADTAWRQLVTYLAGRVA